MSKKNTITTFNDLVDNWTQRMMELDHKVTANRRSIDGLEKQIDETYKEMEDIEKAAHDLLGDKVQFNLYENEDNAIRISYKSNSVSEPLVNIVKDRKIQTGKEPNKSEMYFFSEDGKNLSDEQLASIISMSEYELEQNIIGEDGNYSSIKHGVVGTDEHGEPIQGIKMSVGNIASDIEPHTYHYRVRVPESSVECSPDGINIKGDTITFGGDVKLTRYEEQFNSLSSKVDTLEKDISESIELLEEWLTPKQDPVPMDFDEEKNADKSPVLSEEDDKTTKSIIEMVSHLDENHLKRLRANLDGTYVYDMEDFHALVTQLFILQEAEKAKNTEKEVR